MTSMGTEAEEIGVTTEGVRGLCDSIDQGQIPGLRCGEIPNDGVIGRDCESGVDHSAGQVPCRNRSDLLGGNIHLDECEASNGQGT